MSEVSTVIKFGAPWCQPCKQIEPVLAAAAKRNPDVTYMEVDIEEDRMVLDSWGVMGVPTVVALDANGEEIQRAVGGPAATALLKGQ